jgi:hypothetical protein
MGARLRRCAVPALRDRLALGALTDKALARTLTRMVWALDASADVLLGTEP